LAKKRTIREAYRILYVVLYNPGRKQHVLYGLRKTSGNDKIIYVLSGNGGVCDAANR